MLHELPAPPCIIPCPETPKPLEEPGQLLLFPTAAVAAVAAQGGTVEPCPFGLCRWCIKKADAPDTTP